MQKLIAAIFLAIVLSGTAMAQTTESPASAPATVAPAANPNAGDFKFVEETWDFGKIPQNKPVTHTFNFTNTGKEPIVITNCEVTCGCTTPKWPKEPILPGKSEVIQVSYNAAHSGGFSKPVTIRSNAKDPGKVITIKGEVEAVAAVQTTPDKPTPNAIAPVPAGNTPK